jgi:hypothetical protein
MLVNPNLRGIANYGVGYNNIGKSIGDAHKFINIYLAA